MRLKDGIVFNKIENEGVLFNQENGHFYSLNEIASRIIENMLSGKDVDGIVDVLSSEYDSERTAIFEDVKSYIKEIREMGLLLD